MLQRPCLFVTECCPVYMSRWTEPKATPTSTSPGCVLHLAPQARVRLYYLPGAQFFLGHVARFRARVIRGKLGIQPRTVGGVDEISHRHDREVAGRVWHLLFRG